MGVQGQNLGFVFLALAFQLREKVDGIVFWFWSVAAYFFHLLVKIVHQDSTLFLDFVNIEEFFGMLVDISVQLSEFFFLLSSASVDFLL